MILKTKYKLAKVIDRTQGHEWGVDGLQMTCVFNPCCLFLPDVFDTSDEADEFRSLKDYPEDYIIIQIW